jgi:small subunit ribosomal protein S2
MTTKTKDESAGRQPAAEARTTIKKFTSHRAPRLTKETTNEASSVVEQPVITNVKPANSPKTFQSFKEAIEKKIDAFFEANKDSGLHKLVSASKLMEAGSHVGMPIKFWNPKMKPYIYNKKGNKNQVIDVLKTMVFLDRAYNFLKDITKDGGRVLLVGTKGDIIKEHVKNEAKRVKAFYVNQR